MNMYQSDIARERMKKKSDEMWRGREGRTQKKSKKNKM